MDLAMHFCPWERDLRQKMIWTQFLLHFKAALQSSVFRERMCVLVMGSGDQLGR